MDDGRCDRGGPTAAHGPTTAEHPAEPDAARLAHPKHRERVNSIRVLIVDHSPEARNGLRSILESQADIEVVGVAASGKDGTAMVGSLHPDVVLVDAQMPGIDGAETTRRIKRLLPDAAVIVLAVHTAYIDEAIASGADRALLKDSGRRVLLEAVRSVVAT